MKWAAGFLEGEGCFSLADGPDVKNRRPRVSANQKEREPLDRLVAVLGGTITQPPSRGGQYDWHITKAEDAAAAMRRLLPHLSQRRQGQVKAALGVQSKSDLTDGELMGLVRQHLYVPDGKAPKGYHDGRDVTVIRALRKVGLSGYLIADAIEGVRLMCDAGELGRKKPGEKLTMRALYNTGHGVRPLLYQAQETVYQRGKRGAAIRSERPAEQSKPEHISAAVERVLPKTP